MHFHVAIDLNFALLLGPPVGGCRGGESLGEASSAVQRQPLRQSFAWFMVSILESVLNSIPEELPWVRGKGWGRDGHSFNPKLPALWLQSRKTLRG